MHFTELTWLRKSTRQFKSDAVSIEQIRMLLDAARSAPSGGNCQPWHFFIIGDTKLKQQMYEAAGGRQNFLLEAPLHIVVCADFTRTQAKYGKRGKTLYSIQDTAAAIENLLLCAAEMGLATCWCGAFDEKSVSKALQINSDFRPVAIIPVGYAAQDSPKTSRRPIEEISTFIGL